MRIVFTRCDFFFAILKNECCRSFSALGLEQSCESQTSEWENRRAPLARIFVETALDHLLHRLRVLVLATLAVQRWRFIEDRLAENFRRRVVRVWRTTEGELHRSDAEAPDVRCEVRQSGRMRGSDESVRHLLSRMDVAERPREPSRLESPQTTCDSRTGPCSSPDLPTSAILDPGTATKRHQSPRGEPFHRLLDIS